jgi:Cft2 family RNA processing exonuclease
VWEFIRTEEERLVLHRDTSAGGAKQRAEEALRLHRRIRDAFLDVHGHYKQPRPVTLRPKSTLRFLALGGSDEIGKSCYMIELGNKRILVDCGIKPSNSGDIHPDLSRLDRPDAVILTHAHTDHVGWVPALIRHFGDLEIYCSDGTAALLPVVLDDCRHQYVRTQQNRRARAQRITNPALVEDAYDESDVLAVSRHTLSCEYNKPERLPFGDASVCFYRAGHILGASSVLLTDDSGRRIFFSGDFASFPQETVGAADWPEDLGEVDLLVLESTYGGSTHEPARNNRLKLLSIIHETTQVRKGTALLASFALGRAQELLKHIWKAKLSGELPDALPIYVDGLIRKINPIYLIHASFDPPADAFHEIRGRYDRQEVALRATQTPSVIVSTSGMLTGGPIVEYARHLLPDPRHRLVLTGYQDECAPSSALRELAPGGSSKRRISLEADDGSLITIEAAMPAEEVRLSAHADQPGLLAYAARVRPKQIALVHGERIAQAQLRARLLQLHPDAQVLAGPPELTVP